MARNPGRDPLSVAVAKAQEWLETRFPGMRIRLSDRVRCQSAGVASDCLAHAHCRADDPQRGRICVSLDCAPREIWDGRPGKTLLHEVAHILSPCTHNEEWAETFYRLLRRERRTSEAAADRIVSDDMATAHNWEARQ